MRANSISMYFVIAAFLSLAVWLVIGGLKLSMWIPAVPPASAKVARAPRFIPEGAVATVDLARIFDKYQKVQSIQQSLARKFEPQRAALELQMRAQQAAAATVTSAQAAATSQQIDTALNGLTNEVETARLECMREILNDITNAVNAKAQSNKLSFVLRRDKGESIPRPADYKRLRESSAQPKIVAELLDEIKKDLVLYRRDPKSDYPPDVSVTADITDDVLDSLNSPAK